MATKKRKLKTDAEVTSFEINRIGRRQCWRVKLELLTMRGKIEMDMEVPTKLAEKLARTARGKYVSLDALFGESV
jgi:hypothetical protein